VIDRTKRQVGERWSFFTVAVVVVNDASRFLSAASRSRQSHFQRAALGVEVEVSSYRPAWVFEKVATDDV
jgi:hypothetical protein